MKIIMKHIGFCFMTPGSSIAVKLNDVDSWLMYLKFGCHGSVIICVGPFVPLSFGCFSGQFHQSSIASFVFSGDR